MRRRELRQAVGVVALGPALLLLGSALVPVPAERPASRVHSLCSAQGTLEADHFWDELRERAPEKFARVREICATCPESAACAPVGSVERWYRTPGESAGQETTGGES